MNHLQIGLIIEQSVPCRAQRSSATAVVPANNAGDETSAHEIRPGRTPIGEHRRKVELEPS